MSNSNYFLDQTTYHISLLRERVYNTEAFKNSLISNLESSINAINVEFIPEQFGGWSINIDTDPSRDPLTYILAVQMILAAFTSSISNIDRNLFYQLDSLSNIINIMLTGEHSVVVKI